MDSAWNIFDHSWPCAFRRKPGWRRYEPDRRHLRRDRRHPVPDQQIVSHPFRYEQPPCREAVHLISQSFFVIAFSKFFRAEVAMSTEHPRYRWFVIAVFFFFMLLHQT